MFEQVDIFDGHHGWMFPVSQWKYYGKLLKEAKSYIEFAMMCAVHGYVNPDPNRRHDETLDLCNRHEPYEEFIFSTACGAHSRKSLYNKARKFRDELIELEIKNGERDSNGTIIPTRYQIQHCKLTREWCKKYHPEFFELRGLQSD